MALNQTEKIDQLFREVARKGLSRRQMIQRAAVLGISAPALTVAFVQKSQQAMAQGADNPLGVDPDAPLDVVIFKGGWGDEYAINVEDNLYKTLYPNATITHTGTQRLQEQYQARFVDGNPPDVMDNSGAGNFPITTLVNEGQLADLQPLFDAPAYGQEDITVLDSLLTNSQETNKFDGVYYGVNYVYTLWGLYTDSALFEKNGWTYPTTWDEMLTLCEEIKGAGIAPWTYAGQYPQYCRIPAEGMLLKYAGWDAFLKVDNLAEDAFTQEPMKEIVAAWKDLYDKGYILDGTEALDHTGSQAEFLAGRAAFVPNGSWMPNEMKDTTPEGVELSLHALPSFTDNDAYPQSAIIANPGETFIVPSQAKNVPGGMEFIRLLLSREAGEFFAENVQAPTVIKGVGEGKDLGPAYNSVAQAISDAAGYTFGVTRYAAWYPTLQEESQFQWGSLMTGQVSVDEFCTAMQDAVDAVREDDSITKYTREEEPFQSEAAPGASPAASPAATPAN